MLLEAEDGNHALAAPGETGRNRGMEVTGKVSHWPAGITPPPLAGACLVEAISSDKMCSAWARLLAAKQNVTLRKLPDAGQSGAPILAFPPSWLSLPHVPISMLSDRTVAC
jgi:hypothetical protein